MEAADTLVVIGVSLDCAAFAGVGTCPIARRDFTRKVPWWATAACAALAGVVPCPCSPSRARRPSISWPRVACPSHAGRALVVPAAALLGGLMTSVVLSTV
ncbi:hypothetical protein [Streptomyces sp. KMM 9044]|uniref:hypothetical protein n=1 Tax=Streptomyces sp. KMM 9044 TaxID=2744474 RepID=UPI002151B16F|nr:hypothetical protein [Streptomyces sp. KMM 9044]WAX76740.1 hypothetical protein HUV60_002685 [Streptomyces sp. KMM 9044]